MTQLKRLIVTLSTTCIALGFLLPVRAADAPTTPASRTAEQILTEFKAATPAQPDIEKYRSDPEYRKEFEKTYNEGLANQRKLGQELLDTYPDDPSDKDVMPMVWMQSPSADPKETFDAIDHFIASSKNDLNIRTAKYLRTVLTLRGKDDSATKLAAVNQFIADAPDMKKESAMLLLGYSSKLPPAESAVVLKRVVTEYPGTEAANRATGMLRVAEAEGKPFELEFTDAIGGAKISMKDLKGEVVVIDFWATWCGPCVGEMPHMKELYSKYKDKGVEFIGVSLDQPEADGGLKALKDFVAKNEIGWPQYYQGKGWESEFSRGWGINSIPQMFVVDADGNLSSTSARGQLETIIPKLLEKRDAK